jgi:hypothetical protein
MKLCWQLSVCLSACRSVCLSACPSVCLLLSLFLFYMCAFLYLCVCVCLFVCMSVTRFFRPLGSFRLFVLLSVHQSFGTSDSLSVCPSVYSLDYLSVHLFTRPFNICSLVGVSFHLPVRLSVRLSICPTIHFPSDYPSVCLSKNLYMASCLLFLLKVVEQFGLTSNA